MIRQTSHPSTTKNTLNDAEIVPPLRPPSADNIPSFEKSKQPARFSSLEFLSGEEGEEKMFTSLLFVSPESQF